MNTLQDSVTKEEEKMHVTHYNLANFLHKYSSLMFKAPGKSTKLNLEQNTGNIERFKGHKE